MTGSAKFAPRSADDVVRLIEEHALAWVLASDENGLFSAAAPFCLQAEKAEFHALVGHVPRSSRLAKVLRKPAKVLLLFSGPNTYVSPSWFSNRTQAPTWNFASAQFEVEAQLIDDPGFLQQHLVELVNTLERRRSNAWRVDEMGDRYDKLAERIVAVQANILTWESRFKLGQDEPDETFAEIMTALEAEGSDDVLHWMRAFNDSR